jgi:hypothetical protein
MQEHHAATSTDSILLPSPTAWPLVLALGIALILGGMVTHLVIGILGLVLTLVGAVGWFFDVLPHEAHEAVDISAVPVPVSTVRTVNPQVFAAEAPRVVLPVQRFRFSTGLRGGIGGGIAMIIPATLFSLLEYHSLWYASNLLAAGGFVSWAGASDAFLSQFHLQGLLAAMVIHFMVSLLVGLLYGALLPMFPKYPILTAGFMVPLLFTGIMYSALGIVSPILNERINWFWFVVSQLTFGLVCGFIVNLHTKIRTPQYRALPFRYRAGLDTDPGIHHQVDSSTASNDEELPR